MVDAQDTPPSETAILDAADDGPVEGSTAEVELSPKLVTLSKPGSIQAESIGALRTHILAQHVNDGKRSLAICAPKAGVGTTYIAANLSVAMAQAGVKTLLLEANLRNPDISDYISVPDVKNGLLQCLDENEAMLGDSICRDVIPNLSVLYAGGTAANAQQLLANSNFKDLASACMRDFDLVIADTPAMDSFADARRIASVLRYALPIVRRNDTFVSDVKRLVEDLQADRAQILGTFMNEY
ncbi:hypothetical protein MNBD_ALPHA04-829 [hydrothermal vent metagenome]|uniref:AAA domain-containing protein n=1 Tax=hydrothermal vent metagenome TaxID=652676 RepID=A0A3B0RV79_9ZZZZ